MSRYLVCRDGVLAEETTDIAELWTDDLVTVALGCSFTFEKALMRQGIPVRHIEMGHNVPMYHSNLALAPAGPFAGEMVVTMRPIPADQVAAAHQISGCFPQAHGAPIATGDPAEIGVRDLAAPDWCEPVDIHAGEVPVYWVCGVTPQNVLFGCQTAVLYHPCTGSHADR